MRYLFGDVKSILKFSVFCVSCVLFVCCLVYLFSSGLPAILTNDFFFFTVGFCSCLSVCLGIGICAYVVDLVRTVFVFKRLRRYFKEEK